MAAELHITPSRATSSNGLNLDGAKWYFYQSGTTTPQSVYTTADLNVAHSNPVEADAAGKFPNIFFDASLSYRGVLKTADDVTTIYDIDPINSAVLSQLADPSGAALIGFSHDETYPQGTVGNSLKRTINITDAPYNAVLDGVADCSTAIIAAIADLPATGGTIIIPDGTGCKLDSTVSTGAKPVRFEIGHIRIICPAGEHGIKLQANGSHVIGAGKWATIFQMTAPSSAMVLPTITTTLTTGAVTGTSIVGGSGMRSCPVAVLTESPAQADTQNPDAGLVLTQSGGTVSNAAIVAAGTGYVAAPSVTIVGGGHAAVMIDNVQACNVRGFSVDFQNVPGTVGVYHRGGWWVHVEDVDTFYNVTTGVSSENATSIGLVVDSYTLGSPGTTGGYGGAYVSQYTNLHFTRRALIGHDTSTGTTFQFNRCDFKNSWIHACVDVVDIGPVAQGSTGYFYDLINVDGLTIVGGDFESSAGWFHFIGSCSNIKAYNVMSFSASGTRFRGQPGTGSYFDFAKTNDTATNEILRFGSAGAAGMAFQNTGWKNKSRVSVPYSGDTVVFANNLRLISSTEGNLDDTAQGGTAIAMNTSGQLFVYIASAGANPRTLTQIALFDGSANVSSTYKVGGTQVVGARGAAVADASGGATVDAEARTAINTLLSRLRTHGLIAP